jgi:hypothetical protein
MEFQLMEIQWLFFFPFARMLCEVECWAKLIFDKLTLAFDKRSWSA